MLVLTVFPIQYTFHGVTFIYSKRTASSVQGHIIPTLIELLLLLSQSRSHNSLIPLNYLQVPPQSSDATAVNHSQT